MRISKYLAMLLVSSSLLSAVAYAEESSAQSSSEVTSSSSKGASSSKDSSSTTESSSTTSSEKTTDNELAKPLDLDLSLVYSTNGEAYEVPEDIKEIAGFYTGENKRTRYELNVNEDGTYNLLTFEYSAWSTNFYRYFDKDNANQISNYSQSIEGENYSEVSIKLTRGIVVNAFGADRLVSLESIDNIKPYLDQTGEVDWAKTLISKGIYQQRFNLSLSDLELTDDSIRSVYKELFSNTYQENGTEQLTYEIMQHSLAAYPEVSASDGIAISSEVTLAKTDGNNTLSEVAFSELLAEDKVRSYFATVNDLYQLGDTALNNEYEVTAISDEEQFFDKNGKEIEPELGFIFHDISRGKATFIYNNKLYFEVDEQDGVYVIND